MVVVLEGCAYYFERVRGVGVRIVGVGARGGGKRWDRVRYER